MSQFLRRIGGFTANGIITGVATLLSLAMIINLLGAHAWSIFAVAQAAGLLLAVLVGFGWAVIGPPLVAPLSRSERVTEFIISVWVRGAALLIISLTALVVSWTGVLPEIAEYVPVTIAYAATGLSSLWFFVGTGQAWASFFLDAVPRAVASIAAPLIATLGPAQPLLGVTILSGTLFSLVTTTMYVCRDGSETWTSRRSLLGPTVRRQLHGLTSGSISSVYMTLPTVVVGALIPGAAAAFALGDKLVRLASTAVLPATQVLQGWVPRARPEERRERVVRAVRLMAVSGPLIGLLMVCAAPLAASILSSGSVEVGLALSIPMGVVLACTLVTQVTGAGCLGAFGDYRAIAASAAIGAAVGLPLLFVATSAWGAPGTMWSVAAAECAVLLYQLTRVRIHLMRAA